MNAPDPQSRPLTGAWDQWCVFSDKPYIKFIEMDGQRIAQESQLNPETGALILANFRAQKDNLPCTLGHRASTDEKARWKTAEYNAFAMWVGGRCVDLATHDRTVLAPEQGQLPQPDNGDPPEDGLYVHRSFVTELGAACLAKQAVKKTSPEFLTDALDQHAQPIGPQAQGLAWTDSPFLDGCEIKYERSKPMHKKLMEAGCMEGDGPEETMKKLSQHYGRKAMMEAGVAAADSAADALTKFAKCHMADDDMMDMESGDADSKKGQEHKEPDADNKPREYGQDPIVKPGAPTYIDNPPQDNHVVGGHAMERGSQQTIEALAGRLKAEQQARAALEGRLVKMENADKRTKAQSAVDAAWSAGQIVPRVNELDEQAKARFMALYESGKTNFENALAPAGTHTTKEQVMGTRLAHGGLPLNFERGETVEMEEDRPDMEILRLVAEKQKAGKKGDMLALARQVCMERPALGTAYRQQSRAAFFA